MDRYEKALELARAYYDKDTNAFLDTIFPELKESRDEQIRKAIIKSLDMPFPEDNLPGTDVTYAEAVAWLEKQNHDGKKWITPAELNRLLTLRYEAGFNDGVRSEKEKQKDHFRDDTKMVEQKPANPSDEELQRHQDELYNFKVFAARQAREHHISFVHDFEWNNFCEELLSYFNEEQKPADEQFPPLGGLDAIKAKFYDMGFKNGFDEGVESVKPAEWDEYTKTNLDRALQIIKDAKGKLQGYQTDDGFYECDKAIECLEHFLYRGLEIEKSAEWSEEDKKMLDLVISNYKYMTRKLRKGDGSDDVAGDIEVFSWLEYLPERLNLQPKQEWGEEDKRMIQPMDTEQEDSNMTHYKVTVDDQIVDDGLSYREACELASEIDNDPRYYWKTVDVVPMEEEL